ncbi:MAG: DNA alkylation repair protein [Dehalococcoidales bacterium]|nr:DNA alkylation repair protein [Dehalococcoidales bacterium]
MGKDIIAEIRKELLQQVDAKTRDSAQRFFKEAVKVYGVKTALVEKMAAQRYAEIKHFSKQEVFAICEELLKSDYMEEAFIAFAWAYRRREEYQPEDFTLFESWLEQYVNNWAKCDTLCNHTVGAFVEKYPQYIANLKQWTASPNRWLRRASAVTLIIPARRGAFLKEVLEITDRLLLDKDDLVQKGYGWLLKEAGREHQQEVFDYVMRYKKEMPRTALRYAIEKMPADLKRQAMQR